VGHPPANGDSLSNMLRKVDNARRWVGHVGGARRGRVNVVGVASFNAIPAMGVVVPLGPTPLSRRCPCIGVWHT
jgi:hypothetical protein